MRIKKISFALLGAAILLLCLGGALAEVTWNVSAGVLTISGTGAMDDYTSSAAAPWASVADTIVSAEVQSGVTAIGNYAFADLENLSGVTISSTVRRIGSHAFAGSGLTEIDLPDGIARIGESAFSGCADLLSVSLPDNLHTIESSAFSGCTSLANVDLPYGTVRIESGAFALCSALESIYFPGSVSYIGSNAIPKTTEFVAVVAGWPWNYASQNGYAIDTEIEQIAAGICGENVWWALDEKGNLVFSHTGAIDDVSGWADYADQIKTITIYSNVSSICANAFANCTSLYRVLIEDSVTSIGSNAFASDVKIIAGAGSAAETYANQNGNPFVRRDAILTEPCGDNAECVLLENGALSITGTGKLYADVPWAKYASSILTASVGSGITDIPAYAFDGCKNMESVSLGESVATIGGSAFAGCAKLTQITLPASVRSVGEYALSGCAALTQVTINTNTENIAWNAFDGCTALNEFIVSAGNQTYSCVGGALLSADGTKLIRVPCARTDYTVPDTVTEIGDAAFEYCARLATVVIHKDVAAIGANAFTGCGTGLTLYGAKDSAAQTYAGNHSMKFEIIGEIAGGTCGGSAAWSLDSAGILTISGSGAVTSAPWSEYAASITSVSVGTGITALCDRAFEDCAGIASVTLNAGITSIGEGAFYGCTALTSVILPTSVTTLGARAFSLCEKLESVTLSSGMEILDEYTFADCAALTTVTIPSGIRVVCAHAFDGCAALASLTLPDSAESIGASAFAGCAALTDLYIPAQVTHIGDLGISANLTIHSIADSTAASYAAAHEITFAAMSSVAGGVCGDSLTWKLDAFGRLTISGSGLMYDYDDANLPPWSDHSAEIRTVVVGSGVTRVGKAAFKNYTGIALVRIEGVDTIIRISAFAGCSNAMVFVCTKGSDADDYADEMGFVCRGTDVIAEGSNWKLTTDGKLTVSGSAQIGWTAWRDQITSLALSGMDTIADNMFRDCDGIVEVEIPSGVTAIGAYAFAYCDGLRSITIPNTVVTIADTAFYNGGTEKKNITILCSTGSAAQIFAAAKGIGYSADGILGSGSCGTSANWSLAANGTLTISGSGAIKSYTAAGAPWYSLRARIVKVVIAEGITSIGSNAFNGATALTCAELKRGITSIGSNAFNGADSLVIVCDIGSYAFEYANAYDIDFEIVSTPESDKIAVLPAAINTVSEEAFSGDDAIEVVILPSGISSVGALAFADCENLYRVEIPAGISYIAPTAFRDSPNVYIICTAGGVAQQFAENNDIPYIIR